MDGEQPGEQLGSFGEPTDGVPPQHGPTREREHHAGHAVGQCAELPMLTCVASQVVVGQRPAKRLGLLKCQGQSFTRDRIDVARRVTDQGEIAAGDALDALAERTTPGILRPVLGDTDALPKRGVRFDEGVEAAAGLAAPQDRDADLVVAHRGDVGFRSGLPMHLDEVAPWRDREVTPNAEPLPARGRVVAAQPGLCP